MPTEDRDSKKLPPASGAPEHGEKAAAAMVEPQPSAPRTSGVQPSEEQRQDAPQNQTKPGGSTGTRPDDRMVPAGPRPPHDHVVQDGAAEVAAGAGGRSIATPKKKTAKKVGAKTAITKKGGAPRKDRCGKLKGPACLPDLWMIGVLYSQKQVILTALLRNSEVS
ncbi:UNVERIFIED_CONTAM: hypothetical protein K2H54_055335 [Gekko kuhli]